MVLKKNIFNLVCPFPCGDHNSFFARRRSGLKTDLLFANVDHYFVLFLLGQTLGYTFFRRKDISLSIKRRISESIHSKDKYNTRKDMAFLQNSR